MIDQYCIQKCKHDHVFVFLVSHSASLYNDIENNLNKTIVQSVSIVTIVLSPAVCVRVRVCVCVCVCACVRAV